jgi:hypothetical protein
MPFAAREERLGGLLAGHRKLGVQQPQRVGTDRLALVPAVEPVRARAPELDPAVQAPREHGCVIQDLQQLAGLLDALAQRHPRRQLGFQQPLTQCPLRLGPFGGAPLRVGAAHHGGHAERRHQREADERPDEESEHDMLLVEAEAEREEAADGEEHRDRDRQRQQPAQKDRARVAPRDQVGQGGEMGGGRDAEREQEENRCVCEREPDPGRERVELRHAGHVPDHGDQRKPSGRHEGGDVRPPVQEMPLVHRQEQRESQQEEAGGGDRCGTAGKRRRDPLYVVGEEEGVEPQLPPDEILDQHQGGDQDHQTRRSRLVPRQARQHREQARTGEDEHDRHQRHGLGQEQRRGDSGAAAEHVRLDRGEPEDGRNGARNERELAQPHRHASGRSHSRRGGRGAVDPVGHARSN